MRALSGISGYALSHNWLLMIEQISSKSPSRRIWHADEIDGMLVGAIAPVDFELAELGRPVVNFTAMRAGQLTTVCPDDQAVGRRAAEYLMALPLRHFAFLGQPDRHYSIDRQAGFTQALEQRGYRCICLVTWPANEIRTWLEQLPKPVGLLVANDFEAAGVLRLCNQLRIEKQIAVVGVDNDLRICENSHPPLSSVDLHIEAVGFEAARTLHAMLQGQSVARVRALPPGEVVERDSTRLAAMDPEVSRALTIIRQNHGQVGGVEGLLQHVPLTRRTLERRFRSTIGRTIQQEIERVRLDHARLLLRTTSLPIGEVAAICGYNSASWFSRAMRAESGLTPSHYRRRYRQAVADGVADAGASA